MKNYERKIYLNNAATSWPKPACVGEAMGEAVKALPGSGGRGGIEEFDIFQAVREELAEWLGISCPEHPTVIPASGAVTSATPATVTT